MFVSQGHMCATPDIFAHLTHLLKSLAGGKLCAVLEVTVTHRLMIFNGVTLF